MLLICSFVFFTSACHTLRPESQIASFAIESAPAGNRKAYSRRDDHIHARKHTDNVDLFFYCPYGSLPPCAGSSLFFQLLNTPRCGELGPCTITSLDAQVQGR